MNEIAGIGTDPDLLDRFYRAHIEDVQRFIARRVEDPHRAADLTAEVFVTAIESAHTYRSGRGTPRAWLFGVARNVVRNQARADQRHRDLIERYVRRGDLAPDAMERAVERLDAATAARRYIAAIQVLPPRLREVLELVVVDDLSVGEAAAVLGISAGTARVRLHRARQRLHSDQTTTMPINEGARP